MADKDWVVEVDDQLKNMADASIETLQWNKRSIYKVPASVTELTKKTSIYRPQTASFGPYHHGEAHLNTMEEHKQRALLHFLKRSRKPLESFVGALDEVAQDLKDSYDLLDPVWQNDTRKFLQLMILDGCFMLELLRTATHSFDDYAPNDPIFSTHGKLYMVPYIKRDMLMLENQLPMLVLEKLVAVESDQSKDEDYVNKLILKFCSPSTPVSSLGKCLHVLDVYRKSLLVEQPRKRRSSSIDDESGDHIIRSATELHEAGIRFKKSRSDSLRDINFKNGLLTLPVVVVDDATESMFLNLIAFERFHVGAGNEVTSYIFFMDNLVDNDKDVALLNWNGIIHNVMGSDKAVAHLFNSLSKDITLDPESSLNVVHKEVNKYCKKPWNKWRANLIHTYFRSPWAMLSLVAAIVLFALTFGQTVYTIYPFVHKSPSPAPMTMAPPPPPRFILPRFSPPHI